MEDENGKVIRRKRGLSEVGVDRVYEERGR